MGYIAANLKSFLEHISIYEQVTNDEERWSLLFNFLENWFWSEATLVLWLISLEACTPLDVLVPVGLHVLLSKLNSSHIALLIGWQDGVVGIDKKNKSVKKDMHETTLSIKKKRKIQ